MSPQHNLLEEKLSGQVDEEDYQEFSRRLKTELDQITAELFAAEGQTVEIDVALDFVEHLLWNTRNLWINSGFELKQRIQSALFPNGLILSKQVLEPL
jgi:hypothetical protein